MPFTPTQWDENTDITPEELQRMDDGIANVTERVESHFQFSGMLGGGVGVAFTIGKTSGVILQDLVTEVPAGAKLVIKRSRWWFDPGTDVSIVISPSHAQDPNAWDSGGRQGDVSPDWVLYDNSSGPSAELVPIRIWVQSHGANESNPLGKSCSWWVEMAIETQ